MSALIVLAAMLALIPVADRLAARLSAALNDEWRATALEWAQESRADAALMARLEGVPAVPVPALSRRESWLMGAAVALLTAGWVWLYGGGDLPRTGLAVALGLGLLVAILVDLRIHLLPDAVFWPLVALGIAATVLGYGPDPRTALIGALAGGGALWLLATGYRLLRGRQGLGLGDVKLVALAGLWLGWMPLPWLLMIACGCAIAFFVVLHRAAPDQRMAFGPALACGFLAARILAPLIPGLPGV